MAQISEQVNELLVQRNALESQIREQQVTVIRKVIAKLTQDARLRHAVMMTEFDALNQMLRETPFYTDDIDFLIESILGKMKLTTYY